MDIDEILRDYTRNEVNIYSESIYNEIKLKYANKNKMTVYRGINFTTKEEYEIFLKEFKENKGYQSFSAAGFAKTYETALDFSSTTKTYFPTLEVMIEDSKRREFKESMSGYIGVILTAEVEIGDVVDVNLSDEGIEDEVLFEPNQLIKCSLEVIKPFKEKVKEKDFDINQYIKDIPNKEDKLLQYILSNLSSKISEEVKDLLVQRVFEDFNKKASLKIAKDSDEKILADYDNLIVYSRKNYKFGEEPETRINFFIPYFKNLEIDGLISEKQRDLISEKAESIILNALEIHIKYRDKYKINYQSLKNLTPYVSNETKELYMKAISYKKKDTYEDINKNLANIINKGKYSGSKSEAVANEISKLKSFFTEILENLPIEMKDIEKIKKDKSVKRDKLIKGY